MLNENILVMIEHLLKLPHIRLIAGAFFIFAAIIAPLEFHYQFNRSVFNNTDLMKMILISLGVGFPIVVVNSFICYISFNIPIRLEPVNTWYFSAIVGSLLSMLPFYIPMTKLPENAHYKLLDASYFALRVECMIIGILGICMYLYINVLLKKKIVPSNPVPKPNEEKRTTL